MPAYSQLLYGYKGPDAIAQAAARLGLALTADGEAGRVLTTGSDVHTHLDDHEEQAWVHVGTPQAIADRLLATYKRALGLLPGYTYLGPTPPKHPGEEAHAVDTPWGRRRARAFGIDVHYIYGEADADPSDAAIGWALTSRYLPVLLDLEDAHGGYSTLDLSPLPKLDALFKEAFPEWSDARFYVKETFA